MALPKIYNYLEHQWHNNTTPSINEDELNAISYGLSKVDDRVIDITGTLMEDVPQIKEDLEILEPAIENIDTNVERAETAADNAETEALKSEGYALGTQDGVEVTSGEYYQNNAKYYAEIANPPIENTVDFADIITISDAINKAAKDVRLKVEAVQDLHGYDKPWVGGAGKNKLKITRTSGEVRGVTITNNGDTLTLNGTATQAINPDVNSQIYLPDGDYKLSMGTSSLDAQIYGWNGSWVQLGHGTGDVAFTASSTYSYYMACMGMNNGQTLNNVKVYPMIRLATVSDATYEPYENICPITGWDNAKVTRSGKNLYVGSPSFDGYNARSNWTKQDETYNGHAVYKRSEAWGGAYALIPLTEGTYTFSVAVKTSDGGNVAIFVPLTNITTAVVTPTQSTHIPTTTSWTKKSITFTVMQAGTIALRIEKEGSGDIYVSEYQLELGSTATEYEPYKETEETTISLGDTRYGGTLDVTSGVLTLTHGYEKLPSSGWAQDTAYTTHAFFQAIPSFPVPQNGDGGAVPNAICNCYNVGSVHGIDFNNTPNAISIIKYLTSTRVWINDQRFTTTTELNQFLANNDVYICYELATPQTIQLTAEEIDLLYGYNTLFGDCGDISLTYDASGIIHIEEAKLDTETLKTIAAASSDFADFKARIAAL